MKSKILVSPQKYIQGRGVINDLGKWVAVFGKEGYAIMDDFVEGLIGPTVKKSEKKYKVSISQNHFNGESSQQEIDRHVALLKGKDIDVIVGVGGGKTLDTAKAIAYTLGKPVIVCPTLASTDAPTSALTIVYTPEGEFERYLFLPFNPNIVMVDTDIVVQAPVRTLRAGIGDALATFYEARVVVEAGSLNMGGGLSTKAAYALAKLCGDTLYENAEQALKDAAEHKATEAFEAVVEANTLLSGLGFESSGLAAAHSIHDGLTELEETHHLMHGEKVAFGAVCQAVFDDNMEDFEKIVRFCVKVGLATTLKDLHIVENIEEKIKSVAKKTVSEGETIHSYSFKVTADKVYKAIIKADKLATELKERIK